MGRCAGRSSLRLTAGALVLAAACGGDDATGGGSIPPVVTTDAPTRTSTPTSPAVIPAGHPTPPGQSVASALASSGDLRGALIAVDAAVGSAPAHVIAAFEDPLCGTILADQPADRDRASIQCLVNADQDRRGAALVVVVFTTEGDPLVEVWTSDTAGTWVATDSTRDSFGTPGWSTRTCGNLAEAHTDDPWTSPLRCT